MYLFKVECEFTAKDYIPEIMDKPDFYRVKRTSDGICIKEQNKVGVFQSYDHVAMFTEQLIKDGYSEVRVVNSIWERVK